MKRIASVALIIIFLICGAESALADTAAATTMKLEAVTGTVTVKNASGVAQTVRAGMRLYNGYTLSTDAASEAYISLDSAKAVKLGASGKAQIKQSGKRLEVSVSAGELFFNVTAPLKTDESLNVRTSTMVTGVRGSFGWVKPGETGLMHGSVILTRPDGGAVATLSSGQLARADGKPSAITAADVPTLVAREMRDNPELLEQVRRDAPSVDVGELMETLDARIAQEREAERAAQTALEARQAAERGAKTRNTNSGSGSSNRSSGSSSGGYSGNVVTLYTVTYRDNAGGSVFADETNGGLAYGAATPAYRGGVPARPGYTFTGWFPAVTPFVNGNAVYTAQWAEAVDKPDKPDKPDVPDKPDTPDKPDVPDTPDTPDMPDECAVTFRVPDDALLTILNGVAQDSIVEISGVQEIALPRQAELCLCLTRPNPENRGRISLPFRVLVDGRETNSAFLRVTRNMTVEVVETEDSPSEAQLLRRISVTMAVPVSYRNTYGETISMSFIPDENNVIELSSFFSRLSRFKEWETKILTRKVTVSMELAEGATAFPDAQSLSTVRDCYALAWKGMFVVKDSKSIFYSFYFHGAFDDTFFPIRH